MESSFLVFIKKETPLTNSTAVAFSALEASQNCPAILNVLWWKGPSHLHFIKPINCNGTKPGKEPAVL